MKKLLTAFLIFLPYLSTANEVVVEAEKIPYNVKETYQKIHVIDEKLIAQNPNLTLNQLLNKLPQIYSVNNGGDGQSGSLLLRGMDSYHTTVVIDGIIMNDPTDPNKAFNFNLINISDIERIEVLKGAQSQLYGTNSLGGVIFIKTKKAKNEKLTTNIRTKSSYSNRTFSDHQLYGSIHQRLNQLGYKISTQFNHTGNRSSLIKTNGTPEEKDTTNDRSINFNTDWTNGNNHFLDFSASYKDKQTHFDETSPLSPNANSVSRLKDLSIGINHSFQISDRNSSELNFSRKQNKRISLSQGSSYLYRGIDDRINLFLLNQFNSNFDFLFGLHGENIHLKFDESGSLGDKSSNSIGISTGIQKKSTESETYFYSLGIRNDHHQLFKNAATYRAVTGLHLEDDLSIKLSHVKGVNSPSLYTMFGYGGNRDIKPEMSYQYEISLERKFDNQTAIEFTIFQTDFKNKFQYSSQSSRMENIGGAKIQGAEGEIKFSSSYEEISLSASIIDAQAINQSKKLAYRPTSQTKLNYLRKVSDSLEIGFFFQALGKQYDSTNTKRNKYELFDINATYTFSNQLKTSLEVKNILNKGYIVEKNYSQPGRTLSATLDWEI